MLTLTVTPGVTWTSATVANATNLNATATPQVQLAPTGSIGTAYLDMAALATALSDTVRSRNYLRRSNFFWEDWKQPLGLTCPTGVWTENALEWWARPTGSTVAVARNELAPNDASTWSAKITGSLGNTGVQYATWVPSAIGGGLGDGNIVFSVYVFNHSGTAFTASAIMIPATTANERATALGGPTGSATTCAAGVWTRVSVSFAGSTYDLQYGFYAGISVGPMAATSSLSVAQAQLEIASSPSPFIRPVLNPDSFSNIPELTEAERLNGGAVIIRLGNGELRTLPAPSAQLSPAVVGYNTLVGLPEWIDPDGSVTIRAYTGADQLVTVPAGYTQMEVHCWGGGASSNNGRPGGVGGYTWGRFACGAAGTQYMAVVGGAGVFLSSNSAYGFGGNSPAGSAGGGLTGLFSGGTAVAATDSARAIIVAGGGGGVSYNYTVPGSPVTAGGNGHESTSSGGQADFRGYAATGANGGGGGNPGGALLSPASRGGAGSLNSTASAGRPAYTTGAIQSTPRINPVAANQVLTVPGSTVNYYQSQAGQTDKPGLMVIVWLP